MAKLEDRPQPFPWSQSKPVLALRYDVERELKNLLPLTPQELEQRHQIVERTLQLRQHMKPLGIPVDELLHQVREEDHS